MNEEHYIEMLHNPSGFDGARHAILSREGYALGKDAANYVWYAPYDASKFLTLDEAWEHYLMHTARPAIIPTDWPTIKPEDRSSF